VSKATVMTTAPKCGVSIADIVHEGSHFGFLLIHRLGGSPPEVGYIAEGVARSGYSVRCPLLYGHGGSPALLAATTWRQWLGTIEDAHLALAERCDTIIVGGLGVGALLALELAIRRPGSVQGLTLFAPTFWPNGWAMPWYGNALKLIGSKRLANLIRFDERPPYGIKDEVLRDEMLAALASEGRPAADVLGRTVGTLLEVKWLAQNVLRHLADVVQPCLIFHPRDDDRSSLSASQKLQKRLGGVVELIVLDDSYHLVTLDRQRALVLERVLEFADALPQLMARALPAQVD
jgi:carboxylesterase